MRSLSSIFSQNGLSYKMPLRFNNLDIGEFSLVTKRPFVFNNCTYKDIPVAIKCQCRSQDCTCKGTSLLQNATLVSTRLASTNVHQASSFSIHHRSIQIMHHHAALSCLIIFEPRSPDPTSSLDMCGPCSQLWWSSSYSSCHATKYHCDFHGGRTLLKWFLYNMRFESL